MRLLTWGVTFIIALAIAFVLTLTFTQPEFKTTVGAQLFTYKTRQLPVVYYVIGAFAVGLLIGAFQAFITFFRTRGKIFQKNGIIKDLEGKLAQTEQRLAALESGEKQTQNTPDFPAPADSNNFS